MEDLNNFDPLLSTPVVDPQFFTAVPSDATPMHRMIKVFTSPKEALRGIELEKGALTWLIPLLISTLLTATSFGLRYLTTNAAEEEHLWRVQNYTRFSTDKNLDEPKRKEFARQAREEKPQVGTYAMGGFVNGILIRLAGTLFSCLVFFTIAKVIYNANHIMFHMVLVAASITLIITGVGDILQLVVQAITEDGTLTISPAAFVSGDPHRALIVFATHFNPFRIWDLTAFSLGLASLVRRPSSVGYAAVFATWAVRVALFTGVSLMFQNIAAG